MHIYMYIYIRINIYTYMYIYIHIYINTKFYMFFSADHIRQAGLVTDYIASKREKKIQYLDTNFSLRLGIAGPPGNQFFEEVLKLLE
jgi:hypothetical protein